MQCPSCRHQAYVINSREEENRRYRRYRCRTCDARFTTYEITAEEYERLQSVKVNIGAIRGAIQALQVVEKVATNGTAKD
jgi:transcriptional regulator NrdR family protein